MAEPKRRRKGDGGLTQPSPGVWRIRVFAGTDVITGNPRQVERTVHGNLRQAQARLSELKAEVAEGKHVGASATVGRLLTEWMAHQERIGNRPGTLEAYRSIIKLHLGPALGNLPIGKLTTHALDTYYGTMTAAGKAPGTVRMHHAVISGALNQAVVWGWLPANPAKAAQPPKLTKTRRHAPTTEEIRRLIDTAGADVDLATAVIVAALTGARRGELCGLRWPDVDWDNGTILIERSRTPTGGDHTGPTKSGDSRRVAIGPGGLAVLRAYRDALEVRCARLGIPPDWDGWILSADGGHTATQVKALTARVSELGRRAKVPVTLHELRHYAATTMIGAGVDVRTAAARLGHTPEMLLRVYAHELPARDRAAAEMLERGVLEKQEGTA